MTSSRGRDPGQDAATFELPLTIRYMEVDAQGVVFNGWYLTYFDEATTAYLRHRGLELARLVADGHDIQLVHTAVHWRAGLRWGDRVGIAVSTARIGRTSFALDFEARRDGVEVTCSARTTYVSVATDGTGARPLPPELAAAIEPVAPLHAAEP